MRQGLFEVFGDGRLGLKADDLNKYSEVITKVGLSIPEGMVIATGIFDLLTQLIDFEKAAKDVDINCPDFLLSINKAILDRMEIGKPYAIRSSALSECGGTGVYKSTFFLPTGNINNDLLHLWHCELSVYASEFTSDAKLWREKKNASIGMAILVQAVIGFHCEDYFLPALSGTAYTSLNGLPTVRTVVGLGTKAVNGGGIIDYNPYNEFLNFQRNLWDQENADAITITGDIDQISSQYEEIHGEIVHGFKAFNNLFVTLTRLQQYGNFYFEWVISQNQVFIVQCAIYDDHLPGDLTIDTNDYFLLLKGSDVLHSGRSSCKCIIYISEWSEKTSAALEYLNKNTHDYLLIIPQDALSELANINNQNGLTLRHFSNAKAVVEIQRFYSREQQLRLLQAGIFLADHSSGMGATHFAQVCQRSDILFVGGEFDLTPLLALPGGMDYRRGLGVTIWNTSTEVIVDAIKKEGFVYISKQPKVNKYSIYQIEDWTHTLRSTANTCESRNLEIADHFYNVHYAIIPNDNPVEFDPFNLDSSEMERLGGINQIIKSLKIVIENGKQVDPYSWNNGLKDYLEQLLSHLVKT